MGFANIDGQEIRAIFVIVVESDEVTYLAAKRRSCVTSKHEHQRPLANAITQMESRMPIEREQSRIGGSIANVQIAIAPLRQSVTKKSVRVSRTAHQVAEHAVTTRENHDQQNRCPLPPTHEFTFLQECRTLTRPGIAVNLGRSRRRTHSTRDNNGVATKF